MLRDGAKYIIISQVINYLLKKIIIKAIWHFGVFLFIHFIVKFNSSVHSLFVVVAIFNNTD